MTNNPAAVKVTQEAKQVWLDAKRASDNCMFCDTDAPDEIAANVIAGALNRRLAAEQRLREQVESLARACRNVKPYLEWTISPESPGHHPTMPSAVGAFIEALADYRTSQ